jgi:hypothetical protein
MDYLKEKKKNENMIRLQDWKHILGLIRHFYRFLRYDTCISDRELD